MCRTSVTRTRRWPPTCSPAGTARPATTPGCSPAPTSTARRSCAPRSPTTSSPQQWADQLVESAWKPLLDTIDIANDDFIRTTEPRHETGRRDLPPEALRRRPHLLGRVRGLLLRRLRGVQAARRPRCETADGDYAGQKRLQDPLAPGRDPQGEELLLPHERSSSSSLLDLYDDAARLRAARERAQRDHAVREAGARRPVDLAVELRLGHQGALGRHARRLRLVRRAAQLRHRDRLRRRRRAVRASLAGRATSSARTSRASTPSSGRRC